MDADHAVAAIKMLVGSYDTMSGHVAAREKDVARLEAENSKLRDSLGRTAARVTQVESANQVLRQETASLKSLVDEQADIIKGLRAVPRSEVQAPVRGGAIGPDEPAERLAR